LFLALFFGVSGLGVVVDGGWWMVDGAWFARFILLT
jgi:hypothetical protein